MNVEFHDEDAMIRHIEFESVGQNIILLFKMILLNNNKNIMILKVSLSFFNIPSKTT